MNELIPQTNLSVMPVMDIQSSLSRRAAIIEFTKQIMVDGVDFGSVPGIEKKTLLKPGAEKLSTFFGLTPTFEIVEKVTDWDKPLFHYQYKCKLYRGEQLIGEGIGSCNSLETKYRWRWVSEADIPRDIHPDDCVTRSSSISEFSFAIDKAETGGKYGKPQEYWDEFKAAIKAGEAIQTKKKTRDGREFDAYQIDTVVYRVPNEEIFSQINTIDKMAQKRALVAAVLVAINASEFFTQDLEDFDTSIIEATAEMVEAEPTKPKPKSKSQQPAKSKPPKQRDPFTPKQLLAKFDKIIKFSKLVDKETGDPFPVEMLHKNAAKLVATHWTKALAGDKDKYHLSLGGIFARESANDLSAPEANAILMWLLGQHYQLSFDAPIIEPASQEAMALYEYLAEVAK